MNGADDLETVALYASVFGKVRANLTARGREIISDSDARQRLGRIIEFYNTRRPHFSLGAQAPDELYFALLASGQQAA